MFAFYYLDNFVFKLLYYIVLNYFCNLISFSNIDRAAKKMKYLRNYSSLNNIESKQPEEKKKPELKAVPKLLKPEFKINRWMVFAMIAAVALFTVFSVTNVIKVNALLKHTNELEQQYLKVKHRNDILKAQINKLEAPERITELAKNRLGMIVIDEAPQFINE